MHIQFIQLNTVKGRLLVYHIPFQRVFPLQSTKLQNNEDTESYVINNIYIMSNPWTLKDGIITYWLSKSTKNIFYCF